MDLQPHINRFETENELGSALSADIARLPESASAKSEGIMGTSMILCVSI